MQTYIHLVVQQGNLECPILCGTTEEVVDWHFVNTYFYYQGRLAWEGHPLCPQCLAHPDLPMLALKYLADKEQGKLALPLESFLAAGITAGHIDRMNKELFEGNTEPVLYPRRDMYVDKL